MVDIPVHSNSTRWEWEGWARAVAGAGGVVAGPIGPGAEVVVDALDGTLMGVLLANDTFDVRRSDSFAAVFSGAMHDGAVVSTDAQTAIDVARWCIAYTEMALRERHGIDAEVWRSDVATLRSALVSGRPAPVTPPLELDGITAAMRADDVDDDGRLVTVGTIRSNGHVRFDLRGVPQHLAELTNMRTVVDRSSGVIEVHSSIRVGAYAAELAQVTAFLIDTSDDLVVAAAPFAVVAAGRAVARLPFAAHRSLDTLKIWLLGSGEPLPDRVTRVSTIATEAARRAARLRRFGIDDLADRFLDESMALWASIGRSPNPTDVPAALRRPYAAEIAEWTAL